jgi:hypothetical protein
MGFPARPIRSLPFVATWLVFVGFALVGRADEPQSPADYDALITKSNREHWAFQAVRAPAVPLVRNAGWIRNPIDAFVLAPLEAKGWRSGDAAKPQALFRRMYLDLVGLPPTLEEQAAFLKDPSPGAFDALGDELLARPAYGERWGRHWLDLVRYAESNGYERDGAKPSVWRYRDYVIRSFNNDKPFDRFLLEQLAGDELPDANAETITALGYYRLGPWDDEPADPAEDRFDQLDDIVSTTSQVFLGLTLGCARCHNHKFEPLTTLDYYRLTAVVSPLQRFQSGRSDLDAPAGSLAELAALAARDKQIGALTGEMAHLRDEFKAEWLKSSRTKLSGDVKNAFLAAPGERTDEQKKLVEKHAQELDEEISEALPTDTKTKVSGLEVQIRRLREATADLPRAYYLHEPSPTSPATARRAPCSIRRTRTLCASGSSG